MHLLVLDTIHGGRILAHALSEEGHAVDMVDIYRGRGGIDASVAGTRDYDMVIAPVHLDPGHQLLRGLTAPVITHHQAVRWIIGKRVPARFIEVTGARGKTTTAHALAHLVQGPGVLHTSCGTVLMPEKENIGRNGITPASLVAAAGAAYSSDRWLIAEVSLGFVGAGDLGILTSLETYAFAAGNRDALSEKLRSGAGLPWLIVPPGSHRSGNRLPADQVAMAAGSTCRYAWNGISGTYENPLLGTEAYRDPLLIATAAACVLGSILPACQFRTDPREEDCFPVRRHSRRGRLQLGDMRKDCTRCDPHGPCAGREECTARPRDRKGGRCYLRRFPRGGGCLGGHG